MSQINIGNLTIDKFYLGDSSNVKIYLCEIKLYPTYVPPTPSGNCYEIISTPITSYTSTDYSSVYSFADKKWYMLNNLNQYEEYGIFETGTSLSDFTYYPNKLVIIGETIYQYQTNGWVDVGNYIVKETSYRVTRNNEALRGKELSTTFKIPYSDIRAIGGHLDLRISTEDGSELNIRDNRYSYRGNRIYNGTVTNDNEYYYYSLPSDAPSSVIIERTEYSELKPIHLIFGSRQVSVQYAEKEVPTAKVYNTVEEMEALGCPTVGVNQYGVVGDDVYQFEETEEWVNKAKSSLKFIAKYNDDNANVIVCNTSNELSKDETQPSYLSKDAMIELYIGNCVTSIGENAFSNCTSLTSVTIPDSVTSIGDTVFRECSGLTSVTIPDSVTSIGQAAFLSCSGLTSVTIPDSVTSIDYDVFNDCTSLTSITIPNSVTIINANAFASCSRLTSVTIGSGVTTIGSTAFSNCTSLTSVTINATTPPTLRTNVFSNTNNCPIYVPAESVGAYKTATNWSSYASRIKAIN